MRSASSTQIDSYWRGVCEEKGIDPSSRHFAFTFCDPAISGTELVSDLVDLTLAGKKRGTAHLLLDFELNAIPLRSVGDYWIVLDASDSAVCVVRITAVDVTPFHRVSAEFAASEGEGDESLEYWRQAHRSYFEPQCALWGRAFSDELQVVCESFELVSP